MTPCSKKSHESGGDIIGISYRERQLVLELEKPWDRSPLQSPHLSQVIQEKILRFSKKNSLTFIGVAPDAEYSKPGFMQIWDTQIKNSVFHTEKYSVPFHNLENFIHNLLFSSADQKDYRVQELNVQDYFLCTHGSRDFCCGKYGYDLYEVLRQEVRAYPTVRVWQCTHLGGHRLAPTMCHVNSMRWWGLLNKESALNIFFQREPVQDLIKYYRGFALLKNVQEQIAERFLFSQNDWSWLFCSSSVSSQKREDRLMSVSVDFTLINERRERRGEFLIEQGDFVSVYSSCTDKESSLQKTYHLKEVICS